MSTQFHKFCLDFFLGKFVYQNFPFQLRSLLFVLFNTFQTIFKNYSRHLWILAPKVALVQGPPAGDGRVQLVPRPQRCHHLLRPQLLLQMRQPGRLDDVFINIRIVILSKCFDYVKMNSSISKRMDEVKWSEMLPFHWLTCWLVLLYWLMDWLINWLFRLL